MIGYQIPCPAGAELGISFGADAVEKLAGRKQIKGLESQRSTKRRALFVQRAPLGNAQDEIDRRREMLILNIEISSSKQP